MGVYLVNGISKQLTFNFKRIIIVLSYTYCPSIQNTSNIISVCGSNVWCERDRWITWWRKNGERVRKEGDDEARGRYRTFY